MLENTERLVAVGPINPETGFPLWHKDAAGTRVEQSLSTAHPNTPADGDAQPSSSSRPGAPATLPDESFYWLAEARMVTGGGARRGRARVVLGLEATFAGTGAVADGQQIVVARIRFRIDDGVPSGSYVVTHPFGETAPMIADDRGRVFETEDIGVAPLQFEGALGGHVAPFLRWTSGAATAPGEADPPAGCLGDGATAHTITGSPFGTNFVRIQGLNISEGNGPRGVLGLDCLRPRRCAPRRSGCPRHHDRPDGAGAHWDRPGARLHLVGRAGRSRCLVCRLAGDGSRDDAAPGTDTAASDPAPGARHRRPVLLVVVCASAFTATWAAAGVLMMLAAALLTGVTEQWTWLQAHPQVPSGLAAVLVGGYQFTPWKKACLTACRSPLGLA